MKLTKAQKASIKEYITSCIKPRGDYSTEYAPCWYAETENPLHFSYYCFMSEMCWEVERNGMQKACQDWLAGLCSAVSLQFFDADLIPLYYQWGVITDKTRGSTVDKRLDGYWQMMAAVLCEMWDELPESVRIIQDVMTRYKLDKVPEVSIDTFDHGRDLYGNGTAHYVCSLDPYVRLCESGSRREQVGYSGANGAALYVLQKLGFNVDTSTKGSYDYEGMAHYRVIL